MTATTIQEETTTLTTSELEMITDLDALSDGELRTVAEKCNKILAARDKRRKEDALARAKEIMADAGLSFPEERVKRGRKKTS